VNLCVALSIVPTKGLTLPFISFGGSSLLVNAAAAGILLNISRHAQQKGDYEEDKAEPPKGENARITPEPEEDPAFGDVFADSQIADVTTSDAAAT